MDSNWPNWEKENIGSILRKKIVKTQDGSGFLLVYDLITLS